MMNRSLILSAGVVLVVALIAGCGQPLWLPENDPGYHYRAYPQQHFRSIPTSSPLYGYWGPGLTRYDMIPMEVYIGEIVPIRSGDTHTGN